MTQVKKSCPGAIRATKGGLGFSVCFKKRGG